MARCRGVDDDELCIARLFELLDLAQHDQVVEPGVDVASVSSTCILASVFAKTPWL